MRHLAAIVLVMACNVEQQKILPSEPAPTQVRDAAPADAGPTQFIGVLTAAQTVSIVPRVAGLLSKVHVGVGDEVVVDEVVAEMDPVQMKEELRAAQAALAAASSAVAKAMVDVEDAKRKLALETKAVEQGVSPTQNVEEARLNVKRTEAVAQQARSAKNVEAARVQTVKANVTDTRLRAPFAGTVAQRFRDAGNRVEAGQPIVKIVGHGSMRLRFGVPTQLANQFKAGTKVTAVIDTIPTPVPATIKQVPPGVDPASGLILVEAELEGTPKDVRPGLGAIVKP
jgi:RND family efflux transporter MFP subunit